MRYIEELRINVSIIRKPYSETNAPCLFLDRDGVLIDDVGHISDPDEVRLMPNVVAFLSSAISMGYVIAILTNQSSVARGISSIGDYNDVTARFLSHLPEFLHPHFIVASFWHPEYSGSEKNCSWRKPGKGMFEYLVSTTQCNLAKSLMIGDKLTDLMPAYDVGVKQLVHINSPSHPHEASLVSDWAHRSHLDVRFCDSLPSNICSLLTIT